MVILSFWRRSDQLQQARRRRVTIRYSWNFTFAQQLLLEWFPFRSLQYVGPNQQLQTRSRNHSIGLIYYATPIDIFKTLVYYCTYCKKCRYEYTLSLLQKHPVICHVQISQVSQGWGTFRPKYLQVSGDTLCYTCICCREGANYFAYRPKPLWK